jgi:hypothetical protein
VAVPKAPVDEDGDLPPAKDYVRLAGERSIMQAVSVA